MARKAKGLPICWVKFVNGDDIIGEIVKYTPLELIIRRPVAVIWTNDTMILSPHALYSASRDLHFNPTKVVACNDVIDSVRKYYAVSLDFASDHAQRFDNIVKRLTNKFEAAILERDKVAFGPTEAELKLLQEEERVQEPTSEDQIQVHPTEEPVPAPAHKVLVDRVAALAEKKGLGKKKNEAGKKEE